MDYLQTDDQTINDLALLTEPGMAFVFELNNKMQAVGGCFENRWPMD